MGTAPEGPIKKKFIAAAGFVSQVTRIGRPGAEERGAPAFVVKSQVLG